MSPFNLYVSHPKEMCSSVSVSSHPCHLNRLLHAKMAWFLHHSFLQCLSGPKGFRQFHFTPVPSYSYWWNKGFWSCAWRFAPHHKEMHPAGSFWDSDTAPRLSLSIPPPAPLLGRQCFLQPFHLRCASQFQISSGLPAFLKMVFDFSFSLSLLLWSSFKDKWRLSSILCYVPCGRFLSRSNFLLQPGVLSPYNFHVCFLFYTCRTRARY